MPNTQQKSFVRWAAAAVVVVLFAGPVFGESPDSNEEPGALGGWRPRLSIGVDVHNVGFTSRFSSGSVPTLAGAPRSASFQGSKRVTVGLFSIEGLLDSPVLSDGLGELRLFVRLGGQLPTTIEHTVFRRQGVEGDPSLGQTADQFFPVRLVGNWSAGIGAAWTVPIADYPITFRSSVEYLGQRVGFSGTATLAERDATLLPPGSETPLFSASASTYETIHSLGPRFAVDVALGQRGPIAFSTYAQVQVYWVVAGRENTLTVANQIGPGSGQMRFETDGLVTQGGAGFRLTWAPR